ncbi:MAG: hypothetical protein AAB649_07580 [Patescibacteria group bacterium]
MEIFGSDKYFKQAMQIKDFITGKVTYDAYGGQYFWINTPDNGQQVLAMLRGWGAIQNMFKDKKGAIDMEEACKFQDQLGEWVAAAINEKMEREKLAAENINK